MASDGVVQEINVPPFLGGLREGVDSALPDTLYEPTYSPDFVNLNIDGGRLETRAGQDLFLAMPGSGRVRLLAAHYETDGTRIRLLARGDGAAAALYDFVVGTDSSFQSTSGGTGLGGTTEPHFRGIPLGDAFYFVDRAGALRKYVETPASGNQVRAVALPAAPAAAAAVKARTYAILEDWTGNSGVAPFGWTESDGSDFEIADASSTEPAPGGGRTVHLDINSTSATGETITENVAGEDLNSNTISFWLKGTTTAQSIVFEYGASAGEFQTALKGIVKNEWSVFHVKVGDIQEIGAKRFRVVQASGSDRDAFIGVMYLPGRLLGSYRWRYTHYDSTTGRESAMSAISNGGTPLDFSALSDEAAFRKSAALSFTSDSGTDTTTNKIRIYRSGGLQELTQDENGVPIWCRVGEVFDQSTTISGTPAAGATSFVVAAATNLAIGDWLVLAKGVTGTNAEEFVRVTNVAGTTITIANGLQFAHTNGQTVQVAFVDNIPNEQVDATARLDAERDDPPSGAKWIAQSPDGRIWLANYPGKPTGIRVSNRATPERPVDYEVFPDNVDPNTRRSVSQGWPFEIGGDSADLEITWLGVFHDRMYAFTRRHLYAINAASQADWGPYAVVKAMSVGCIAGDTAAEVNGWLYWVADGPRVMRWDGTGAPEVISHERINLRLQAATESEWKEWFALYHTDEGGARYRLYFTPGMSEEEEDDSMTEPDELTALLFWFEGDQVGDPPEEA